MKPRPFLPLLIMTLSLTGCATWHRPGTSRPVMELSLAHCQQKALTRFPPDLRRMQTGIGYWQPSTQQCWHRHGYTYCQEYPAQWIPPQYALEDQNTPQRRAWVHACMDAKGFHH